MIRPKQLESGRLTERWTASVPCKYISPLGSSSRGLSKERNVSEVDKQTGIIAVLAKRMVEERLPKALALKERIDKGDVLNELDLNFLEQVVKDATAAKPLMRSDPLVLEVAGRMMELYREITEKALANEQARVDGKK